MIRRIYHLPAYSTDPRLDPYREQLEGLQMELQAKVQAQLEEFFGAVEELTGLGPLVAWDWTWQIRSPEFREQEQ